MRKYIIRRLLVTPLILLGIFTIVFLLMHIMPGDPIRAIYGLEVPEEDVVRIRKLLGLDDPIHVQYFRFLERILRGDLGRSLRTGRPVLEEVAARYPATVELAIVSIFIAILIGVPAGTISAMKRYSAVDYTCMFAALAGLCIPSFWQALLFIIIFGLWLDLLPISGRGGIEYLIMPAMVLGTSAAALIARLTRSAMLETLHQDYIKTARAKGLAEKIVIYRHALKNAMLPVITLVGLQFGALLGGAVIVETIFAWPGIGRLLIESIFARDLPVVQGVVLIFAFTFVCINLFVDILYAYIDPRIRYE